MPRLARLFKGQACRIGRDSIIVDPDMGGVFGHGLARRTHLIKQTQFHLDRPFKQYLMVIRSVIIPRNRDFVDLIVAGFNLKSDLPVRMVLPS